MPLRRPALTLLAAAVTGAAALVTLPAGPAIADARPVGMWLTLISTSSTSDTAPLSGSGQPAVCTVAARSTGTTNLSLAVAHIAYTNEVGRVVEREQLSLSRPVTPRPGQLLTGSRSASQRGVMGCRVERLSSSTPTFRAGVRLTAALTGDEVTSTGLRQLSGTHTDATGRGASAVAITLDFRDSAGVLQRTSSFGVRSLSRGATEQSSTSLPASDLTGLTPTVRVDSAGELVPTARVSLQGREPVVRSKDRPGSVQAYLSGDANAGRRLLLFRVQGRSTALVSSGTTNSNGFADLRVPTARGGTYLLLFPGRTGVPASATPPFQVRVR